MMDNFSTILSNAKEKGKLVFKNSGIKSITKNNLHIPFNDIHYIDISENKLTCFPDVISEFICLEVLLCSHNMIRYIPGNISNISYLETLDLSCNHLTSLHSSVCKLQCLKILIISSNRLLSLPTNIGRLSSLEELDSSCNSLTCLPDELSGLNRLRYLNLRHNKLLDVPTNLHKLNLEVLDLSENQLISIPNEYHRIDTLQTLNLSGNPLNFPPANVCSKGLQHIMKCLQSESRRLCSANLSSQTSIDYNTVNNRFKSDPRPYEINGADSITVTSTNSQHSVGDFDFDLASNEPDDSPQFFPTVCEKFVNFNRCDSGYNTITKSAIESPRHSHKADIENVLPLPPKKQTTDTGNTEHKSGLTLNTVEESAEGHFKKNRYTSSSSRRTVPNVSPAIFRSSRYVSKGVVTDTNKFRRNSLPSNERVPQATNVSNQSGDFGSQCVVVVDNSNTESRKSSSHSIYNQSNNSGANHYIKNASLSSPRAIRSKLAESNLDRKSSATSDILSPRGSIPHGQLTSQKIQEKIVKFHKIIEAQLHVHIDSKKLSEDLSNGIYLCHLANILVPHCITTVHTASPGQQELGKHKAKRNLDNFLEACRRNGVPENCLFSCRDVLNGNPVGLLHMAESVDALIESIRIKKARPLASRTPSAMITRSGDHIDWHGILHNPQSLSGRTRAGSSRSSLQGYQTVGRSSKTTHRVASSTALKAPVNDVVQYSSEV